MINRCALLVRTWREIADEVGLDWRTVNKYLSPDAVCGAAESTVVAGCVTRKIDAVAAVIDPWLAAAPRLMASGMECLWARRDASRLAVLRRLVWFSIGQVLGSARACSTGPAGGVGGVSLGTVSEPSCDDSAVDTRLRGRSFGASAATSSVRYFGGAADQALRCCMTVS